MNHSIIYGAIGFLLGGLTGGFLVGTWFGKEYKKRIDRLEYENEKLRDGRAARKAVEFEEREKKVSENKFAQKSAEEIVKEAGYSHDEAKEEEEEEEDDLDLDDVEFDDPFPDDTGESNGEEIRLISKKAYEEDLNYRDSETLTYYQQDGILADAFDDMVPNSSQIIGIEAIEKADEADDDEVLYVSNDIEDKIYEVIVNRDESFYRDLS